MDKAHFIQFIFQFFENEIIWKKRHLAKKKKKLYLKKMQF